MRCLLPLLLLACAADPVPVDQPIAPYDPLPLVDPMIGTDGLGAQIANVNPGAAMPFGLTLTGPDTRSSYGAPGFYHCAGYHYPDTHIAGFSHTHAHGIGITDYGAIQIMPRAQWDPTHIDVRQRQAPFSHDTEVAKAGSYAVTLDDDQTRVEITATDHGAHHRWTFAPDATPALVLDLAHTLGEDRVNLAQVEIADDGRGAAGPLGAGLRGMRERVRGLGGRLELQRNPGTTLRVLFGQEQSA